MNRNINNRHITVAEMAPHIHNFTYGENKTNKLIKWLIEWLEVSLQKGLIKPHDFLPSKTDLAFHIGVSLGTVQNVYRAVEDYGLIKSKQRIGTYVTDVNDNRTKKLTSKRDLAVEEIKKYIYAQKYKTGDFLESTRCLAKKINQSPATIRNAVNSLTQTGILKKQGNSFVILNTEYSTVNLTNETLVEKTAQEIKMMISKEFSAGNKLPSNPELSQKMGVSIKTIHDALKLLSKEGLILAKRGKYGTIVAGEKQEPYFYEKIEKKIKSFITKECEVGTKLPSIKSFADMFQVSSKTIKKALDMIEQDGYITFTRGRYGGTFVIDIPQPVNEAYTWLALNQDYANNDAN